MLIGQNTEFEFRGPEPPGRTSTPPLVNFMKKQKSQRKIFEWIIVYC